MSFDKVLFVGGEWVKVGGGRVEGGWVSGRVNKEGGGKKISVLS